MGVEEEVSLYKKSEKIIPRTVSGVFANFRVTAVLVLMGWYYLFPWVNWGDRQAILLDMPNRKFYFFDVVIWPQDFFYLTLLLLISALALFFFTNLAGRLWCGYACPQTVWTEVSMWLERITVGNRQKQLKLEKMPWNFEKITRVSAKYLVWIVFSLWTGLTFVGWFSPIRELTVDVFNFMASETEVFWILFYALATWGMAGFMREQVCFYMCPYARFQSAMFDSDTLIISYDYNRGEPRAPLSKSEDNSDKGDCIDCDICVQACPVGIDIRDGLQYECIACSACIDACDEVMAKIGREKGLVRYTTEHALENKKTKIIRPRLVMYFIALLASIVVFFVALNSRMPIEMNIIRDRQGLFSIDSMDNVVNRYEIKLMNMDSKDHKFKFSVISDTLPGVKTKFDFTNNLVVSGGATSFNLFLSVDYKLFKKHAVDVIFKLEAIDDPSLSVTELSRFLGPGLKRR